MDIESSGDVVSDMELLAQRIEKTRREAIGFRVVAATDLRDAVADFNAAPITVSAVDSLREAVLRVADRLAPPAAPMALGVYRDALHSVKA